MKTVQGRDGQQRDGAVLARVFSLGLSKRSRFAAGRTRPCLRLYYVHVNDDMHVWRELVVLTVEVMRGVVVACGFLGSSWTQQHEPWPASSSPCPDACWVIGTASFVLRAIPYKGGHIFALPRKKHCEGAEVPYLLHTLGFVRSLRLGNDAMVPPHDDMPIVEERSPLLRRFALRAPWGIRTTCCEADGWSSMRVLFSFVVVCAVTPHSTKPVM